MRSLAESVKYVRDLLKNVRKTFYQTLDSVDIRKLEAIAQVRFVLKQTAVWMHQLELEVDKDVMLTRCATELKMLFSETQDFCVKAKFNCPRFVCFYYEIITW